MSVGGSDGSTLRLAPKSPKEIADWYLSSSVKEHRRRRDEENEWSGGELR